MDKHKLNLRAADMNPCCQFRKTTRGRFSFCLPDSVSSLILEQIERRDKDWLKKFVFVKIDSIGPDVEYLFHTWHLAADTLRPLPSKGGDEALQKIARLHISECTFPHVIGLDLGGPSADVPVDGEALNDDIRVISSIPAVRLVSSLGATLPRPLTIVERTLLAKRKKPEATTSSASVGSRETTPSPISTRRVVSLCSPYALPVPPKPSTFSSRAATALIFPSAGPNASEVSTYSSPSTSGLPRRVLARDGVVLRAHVGWLRVFGRHHISGRALLHPSSLLAKSIPCGMPRWPGCALLHGFHTPHCVSFLGHPAPQCVRGIACRVLQ